MSTAQDPAAAPTPEAQGFLLQALIHLLGLAPRLGHGDEVRIQPLSGPEQMEFSWTEGGAGQAMRIRSTRSMFLSSQIQGWAAEMETLYEGQLSTLMLIGTVHPRLDKAKEIGTVVLRKRLFDPELILTDAGEAVASFRKSQDLPPLSVSGNMAAASLLASRLGDYAAELRVLPAESLLDLLRQAVIQAGAL